MTPADIERFAGIAGGVAAAAGRAIIDCPYSPGPRRLAWLEGYLRSCVSAAASGNKALAGFHMKPSRRATWSALEIDLLKAARRLEPAPASLIGGLIGRSAASVRVQRCRLAKPNTKRAA